MILLDTHVLIEILKNNQQTVAKINTLPMPLGVSAITAMELIYGARTKQEMNRLQQFINLFEVIPLTPSISNKAMDLATQYAKSHSLDIPDSLIAATAVEQRSKLFTYNINNFRFITGLEIL